MATFADDAVLLEGRGINNGKKAIRDDHLGQASNSASTSLPHTRHGTEYEFITPSQSGPR